MVNLRESDSDCGIDLAITEGFFRNITEAFKWTVTDGGISAIGVDIVNGLDETDHFKRSGLEKVIRIIDFKGITKLYIVE